MKIIKEIEKNRLTEENLNELKGGVGENCSAEAIYKICDSGYSFEPCLMKLSCGSQYIYCTGPDVSQKKICENKYGIIFCGKYS